MEIAIYNSRGVVSRDLSEGGEQESRLVETYRAYARLLSDRWPRTSALLRRVAKYYAVQAHQEDMEAELREDF